MGNIELNLSISRLDLILVGCVLLIAAILSIGFVVWLVKSARQNKSLKSIDDRLAKNFDEKNNENKNTHTVREYVYIDNYGNKTIKKENIQRTLGSNAKEEAEENQYEKGDDTLNVCEKKEFFNDEKNSSLDIEEAEHEEVDVMAEIQKMLKTTESYQMPIIKDKDFNVGKSGKTYSKEDIENIIKD